MSPTHRRQDSHQGDNNYPSRTIGCDSLPHDITLTQVGPEPSLDEAGIHF
jgi:hypothetical protein